MDTNKKITKEEFICINKASEEIAICGKTDIKCPRCNSSLIMEEFGTSYIVKCKKDGCISVTFRGI